MKKVLFVATVESHIIRFHQPVLKYFSDKGYEVHVACSGSKPIENCHVRHDIAFERFPFKLGNIAAHRELTKIIKENDFAVIHCHTPVGGALGRLAAKAAKGSNAKIFYTAHGFHFCRNGPVLNWLLYYPVEKYLSKYTDGLITINNEDYALAKKNFKAAEIYNVSGVGVDLKKFQRRFSDDFKLKKRKSIGLARNDFVLMYVADLHPRKNQGFIINATNILKEEIPRLKIIFVGDDHANGSYQHLADKLGLQNFIYFLGERNDIAELISVADVYVSSSRREGIATNLIEAMAGGKCVVASDVRGNRDVVVQGTAENGFLYNLNDMDEFIRIILKLYRNRRLIAETGSRAMNSVSRYNIEEIKNSIVQIYESFGIDIN